MISKRSRVTHFLFTFPALVLYLIFFIFPVLLGIYFSMTNWNGISRKYDFIGWENYGKVLHDDRFYQALLFTLKYSVLLLVFVISISMLVALLINSKIKFKSFFKVIYFFPAVLSLITVGLIWNEIFYRVIPVIGQMLNIDMLSHSILSNPETAMYGILIVNVWQGVAIPIILFLAGLQSIPSDMYEAAVIDGANPFQKFRYITFPFIVPVLNVVFIVTFKGALMVFDYIMALTQGGPGFATESISLLIYNHAFSERKFAYSVAESIILFILIIAVSYVHHVMTKKKAAYE